MKHIIYILLLFTPVSCQSQNDSTINYISNNKNLNLSPIKDIKLSKKQIDYRFEMNVSYIGFAKYHNKAVAELIGTNEYEMDTALEFISDDNLKIYYYPINKKIFIGLESFEKINKKLKHPIILEIFTTIYRTPSNPIIIIDSVKLKDN